MSIGEGSLICFCYRRVCVTVELMTESQFCNVFCRNGSVCGSLCEIVAGMFGQHGENGVDVLVVDHPEDNA